MANFIKNLKAKIQTLVTPEPLIKQECVSKIVTLLERDFRSDEQNEILLAVVKNLSANREKKLSNLEKEYHVLAQNMVFLNQKIKLEG
jgi:hypothetical protein